MQAETLAQILDTEFYVGVPDSQLKALCNYLMHTYGVNPSHHLIAANEGNAAAIAAGYHLATGKIPAVYLQNSGEGNIINPLASLLSEKVYAIPIIFIIGWRGEPGVPDEPQHIKQGEVTTRLLEEMGLDFFVIGKDTTEGQVRSAMDQFRHLLVKGKCAAFVIRKDALTYGEKVTYRNSYPMTREEILQHIVAASGNDPIISTTGKASRELFEIREVNGQSHTYDFLTVGSMGHSSSIALGVALQHPERRIWCIDGDGAVLMHMGAMAVIGASRPPNFVHIVVNNEAHESVGGLPTVARCIDLAAVALACGYPHAVSVDSPAKLDDVLRDARARRELSFIEAKCAIGARADLGRPTTAPQENKTAFMAHLKTKR